MKRDRPSPLARSLTGHQRPCIVALAVGAALVLGLAAKSASAEGPREVEYQAVRRQVIVVNAAASQVVPKPLLVVLHGRRQPDEPLITSPRLDELAQREGFVVAYSAGVEGRWNYPQQVTEPRMVGDVPADDIGFVLRVIDVLVGEKIADAKRIYVSGTSNGAFLSFGLMCLASERIAGAAVLIASMFEKQVSACKPTRNVPVVAVAGTNDTIVPYDGWLYPADRLTSIAETMEFWRQRHGCTGQKRALLPRGQEGDPTRVVQIDWTGCRPDGAVTLFRVQGGGHTLPSRQPQPPDQGQGIPKERRSTAIETSEVVWTFLKQWSL